MFVTVNGARVHALTGGPAFDASLPTVVFLHGAGMDATVWALQTRWFAHHGYSVLALDLPAHGRTAGPPLTTIEAMAEWVSDVLTTVGVSGATLVGHSMGSLVALATAAAYPVRVRQLVLIGTAPEMRVGPDLLAAAGANSSDAVAMINLWGHGPRAVLGGSEVPGLSMEGAGRKLLEGAQLGVLATDLAACNTFQSASLLPSIQQNALICQGSKDAMTPFRGAQALASKLVGSQVARFPDAGHMLMIEEGAALLETLAAFAQAGRTEARTATQPVGAPP